MSTLLTAAVQMNSSGDVAANCDVARALLERAAAAGARLAVLPENFAAMHAEQSDRARIAEPEGEGPIQEFLSAAARHTGLWIVGGTIPIRSSEPERPHASVLVFDDHGTRVGRYDKMHLFDVTIPGGDESYCESAHTRAGRVPVTLQTPWGELGIAVCYDLRFPELFRYLGATGIDVLVIPSAFTYPTGRAHWETLLRARAIENLCYLVAAAQTGRHPAGRRTYGHSLILDPWGAVLAARDEEVGLATATLDLDRMAALRRNFPALSHRRFRIDVPDV